MGIDCGLLSFCRRLLIGDRLCGVRFRDGEVNFGECVELRNVVCDDLSGDWFSILLFCPAVLLGREIGNR